MTFLSVPSTMLTNQRRRSPVTQEEPLVAPGTLLANRASDDEEPLVIPVANDLSAAQAAREPEPLNLRELVGAEEEPLVAPRWRK